jgi:hypothetical protein
MMLLGKLRFQLPEACGRHGCLVHQLAQASVTTQIRNLYEREHGANLL